MNLRLFLCFSQKNSKKFGGIKKTSYLCNRKQENNALVAQLVEHLTLNQGVQGSNPCRRTKREKEYFSLFFCILPTRLMAHTDYGSTGLTR